MAYAFAYCVHTLEMNALRGWGVAFLGFVATHTGTHVARCWSPTIVLMLWVWSGRLAACWATRPRSALAAAG